VGCVGSGASFASATQLEWAFSRSTPGDRALSVRVAGRGRPWQPPAAVHGVLDRSTRNAFAFAFAGGIQLGCNKEPASSREEAPRATAEGTASSKGSGSSTACGRQPPATGTVRLKAKDGKGKTRDYELLVPSSYDPSKPLALSFVYHGAGGTPESAKAFGLQDAPGAKEASIFVYPRGIEFQNFGVGWDDSCGGYDVALFDQMLSSIESNYCIDTKRVFVAGFSWGCDHATALACCRGEKVRAIAAGSCVDEYNDKSDYHTYVNLPCPAKASSGIRFTHDVNGDTGYPGPLFAMTSALYRSFNGCTNRAAPIDPSPCKSFAGCASPFIECAYSGLGHALPGSWSADSWAFFSTFR
jgi:polyhydroxybutyrate depolymerase